MCVNFIKLLQKGIFYYEEKSHRAGFTLNKHSMALAFRSGTPPKARSTLIESPSTKQPQSAKEALDNLKRTAHGLATSTHELLMEFTDLAQAVRLNGGALPDVNAIAQQVLSASVNSHFTGGGTGEADS